MLVQKNFVRAAAVIAAGALALTGCSSTGSGSLEAVDPWVRAESGHMTAMFGELHNGTGDDLEIESIETDVATTVEMHEMVQDDSGNTIMQESKSGFVIEAGESLVLEPGGDHFMFIDLQHELLAGETVTVTVHFVGGETFAIEATVKEFTGGNEPYGDSDEGEHGGDSESDDHGGDH